MSRFTIFIGGVHGAGKGYLCEKIREKIICDYVSASRLLHWATPSKKVQNISANQRLLSELLPPAIASDRVFLVDGHFSLWNEEGKVEAIELGVFQSCSPNALIVVIDDESRIVARLKERDGIDYSLEQINEIQAVEIDNAKSISLSLGIPLFIVRSAEDVVIDNVIEKLKSMMTRYTRENIYSEMLKTVIIRFDFLGATDIRQFVNSIKKDEVVYKAFPQMRPIPQDQYNFKVSPKDIKDGSLPLYEKQSNTIFRFFDCKLDSDLDVILDITSDAVCLSIDCSKHYNGSKKYTDFMVYLMTKLIKYDPYIRIGRIGVRKLDAQIIPDGKTIYDYFNDSYLAARSWYSGKKDVLNYVEQFRIERVNFNVVQHIDRLPNGSDRAIYDVDAYIVNGDIDAMVADELKLGEFLNNEVQDKMFELFVACASTEYLEECLRAKKAEISE